MSTDRPPLTGRDPSRSLLGSVIAWSLSNQMVVVLLAAGLAIAGWWSFRTMPLDAIPNLNDTQVIIRTDFPGQSPQIVEDLVTYPLSSRLLGLPGASDVRGASMFGTSFVYVIFEDDVDLYWARSRVVETLSSLGNALPAGAVPRIGPDATGTGWVYQYALVDRSGEHDLAELRSLQDWFLKLELSGVRGVAEVASVGGFVREYQVLIDPNRLRAYDVPIGRIIAAVRAAGGEVGGRVLEQGETEYVIRSTGYVDSVADLQQVVVYAANGTPVTLGDVARVVQGPALRRGVVELNGEGETVAGIVVMRDGQNALDVIRRVRARLDELSAGLPPGVEIVTTYDRSALIEGAIDYLNGKLLEEGLIVALVTLLFLLHVRAALVALITLPLGVLGAFMIMGMQGITANIMSLGGIAIAIGAMVDAAIVLVENASGRLAVLDDPNDARARREAVLLAAREVGPGLFVALLIITLSFLPVLALTGESYRLFSPLAFTKTWTMAVAAVLSVTLVPVLMLWLLRGRLRTEADNPISRACTAAYRPILRGVLRHRWLTILMAAALALSAVIPATRLGTEFMPPLDEGELLYMPTTLPGVSSSKMREVLGQTNRLILSVPEVSAVFGKAGRADTATDPAPLSMIESWITLAPRERWRPGMTSERLVDELDALLDMPGLVNSWGYPIKIRTDMVSTGVRTPVGVKIAGDDLDELAGLALEIERTMLGLDGVRSAFAERALGGRYLEIVPDRAELARREIDMGVFQNVVRTALGGLELSQAVEGRERYDIMLRYDRPFRESVEDLDDILVPTPGGAHIPMGEIARIEFTDGPPVVRSENARLNSWVFVDIEGSDLGGFVRRAAAAVSAQVDLPAGYAIEWAGEYEQLEAANDRLRVAVPAALALIFALLMLYFGRLDRTLIVLLAVPFALGGGLWAVWLAGYNLSVAVWVGLIALAGVATETALIMLLFLDQQLRESMPRTATELAQAIEVGAAGRVRPKLMTVLTLLAGLAPVFFTTGPGADVLRRIALPMLGGVAVTAVMTLLVIPAVYSVTVSGVLARQGPDPESSPDGVGDTSAG
jgi:Cu(I)/Ag(I) efflux system membrane protein CusA/SilA